MKSMTGFGSASATCGQTRADVTIHAVNRKHLDIQVNLPTDWTSLESLVHQKVSEHLKRGRAHIQVSLQQVEQSGLPRKNVRIDRELALAYVAELRALQEELGIAGELCIADLLALPELFKVEADTLDAVETKNAVVQALDTALAELLAMREREGEALQRDIKARIENMHHALDQMEASRERIVRHHHQALLKRLAALNAPFDLSDERIQREVALFADRSDISEEITRLRSHLQQAAAALTSPEPTGRTLEFLVQEIFREINTIGSKANDAGLSSLVVEAKSETDRIREQIQNIE